MSRILERLPVPESLKPKKPVDMIGDYTKNYAYKTRFSMLGPVASGKSTIAAGIVYTCATLSSLLPNFFCRVLPTSTHILSDANNLKLGHFPTKTDPYQAKAPEAGLLICERGWREKRAQIPICDIAGEITDYIQQKASGFTPSSVIKQRCQQINQEVITTTRDSQGFLVSLAADEALMFRDKPSILDPDVYTYTVLNAIFEYRRQNRKPDPRILVVLTKWDQVMSRAKSIQMDAYDEDQAGFAQFLANGFPNTSMLLKPLVEKGYVKFFRSWFAIKKHEDGSSCYWDEDGEKKNPVIDIYEEPGAYIRFRPKMSEQDYVDLVHTIGSFGQ